jgi:hypothetical protein
LLLKELLRSGGDKGCSKVVTQGMGDMGCCSRNWVAMKGWGRAKYLKC